MMNKSFRRKKKLKISVHRFIIAINRSIVRQFEERTNTNLLRELTGLVWTVEDFVVEDGEVEGKPEPDRVGGLHLALADIKCILRKHRRAIILHICA